MADNLFITILFVIFAIIWTSLTIMSITFKIKNTLRYPGYRFELITYYLLQACLFCCIWGQILGLATFENGTLFVFFGFGFLFLVLWVGYSRLLGERYFKQKFAELEEQEKIIRKRIEDKHAK